MIPAETTAFPTASMQTTQFAASFFSAYLRELHAKYLPIRDGEVASYIPELSKANPDAFGICVITCDGQVYEVGDTDQTFTILRASSA